MDNLTDLIKLVKKHKVNFRDKIGLPTNKRSKLYRLFAGLLDGTYPDEMSAALDIYGTAPDHINFRRLKYRLQERLINTVMLIDAETLFPDKVASQYFECYQHAYTTFMLLSINQRELAIQVASRSIKKAIELEHIYAVVMMGKILQQYYATANYHAKKFEYYDQLLEQYSKIFQIETEASMYLQRLGVCMTHKNYDRQDLVQLSSDHISKLAPYSSSYYSARFTFLFYYLKAFNHLFKKDLLATASICEAGIILLNQQTTGKKFIFSLKDIWLNCKIYLKQFQAGETIIITELDSQSGSKHNTHTLLNRYYQLALHSKRYDRLGNILTLMEKHEMKKSKNAVLSEYVNLAEALYFYFVKTDIVKETHPAKSSIRIKKFINDVPVYSKDRAGQNIPIIVIQLLLSLLYKKNDIIIAKVDALKVYIYRYLRKDDTFRSNCFIKMLVLIPKGDFHPVRVNRYAEPLLKKLKDNPPQSLDFRSLNTEIIPFEDLWNIFLDLLALNKNLPRTYFDLKS